MIVPCWNPAGLRENTRRDSLGRDLNRMFSRTGEGLMAWWEGLVQGARFEIAICLHEDYDATGIYTYELDTRPGGSSVARIGLDACDALLPLELSADVGELPLDRGLIRADSQQLADLLEEFPEDRPEAVELAATKRAAVSLTFETPSEYGLDVRKDTQVLFLKTVTDHLFG